MPEGFYNVPAVAAGSAPATINKALTVVPDKAGLELLLGWGETLLQSGLCPNGLKSKAGVAMVLLRGQELGLGATQALEGLHPINGRLGMSVHLMVALMLRAEIELETVESTAEVCSVKGKRGKRTESITITMEELSRVTVEEWHPTERGRKVKTKLTDRETYKNWPVDMLYARAMSRLARRLAADVIGGLVYTHEEIRDMPQAPTRDVEVISGDKAAPSSGGVSVASVTRTEEPERVVPKKPRGDGPKEEPPSEAAAEEAGTGELPMEPTAEKPKLPTKGLTKAQISLDNGWRALAEKTGTHYDTAKFSTYRGAIYEAMAGDGKRKLRDLDAAACELIRAVLLKAYGHREGGEEVDANTDELDAIVMEHKAEKQKAAAAEGGEA